MEDPKRMERTLKESKHGMIGAIIHEVGHNSFPMIINSDERQWTWMDFRRTESLLCNTLLEQERTILQGSPNIVEYMS